MDKKDETIAALRNALSFYADPGNYHAIGFVFDRPCGGFADDFSKDHGDSDYNRSMPGDLARKTLQAVETGDYSELRCETHGVQLRLEPAMFCQDCVDETLDEA